MGNKNRNGHADLSTTGFKSRIKKAEKVLERIVASENITIGEGEFSILEIGCGSGHLSHLFATSFPNCRVIATDIVNRVQVNLPNNCSFSCVKPQENFPFSDTKFDLVIMNQVLEHVHPEDRDKLFQEILKVLKKNGKLWIAFPNKYSLIEPHYYIPGLSIFPKKIADKILKILKQGDQYDCFPLSVRTSDQFLSKYFSRVENETLGTIFFLLRISRTVKSIPKRLSGASIFSPTLIYVASHPHEK